VKNVFIATVMSILLMGCGTATFESSELKPDYRGTIGKVNFVLQVDSMEEAFKLGTVGTHETIVKKRESMERRFAAAVTAISDGIVSNFNKAGVSATVTVAKNAADTAALAKTIREDQIFHAKVVSYMTATQPGGYRYWDSGLSWSILFVDRNKTANPTGGVVWRTKTGMVMFNFGCADDYRECGDRFGRSIVDELKRSELIAKK